MKKYVMVLVAVILALGCARIKIDVSMRLDIYQHIEKDIDNIENMVSSKDHQSFLDGIISIANADEGLGAEVEAAVQNRKQRRAELLALEAKGSIGENKDGLVEVRGNGASAQALVSAENSDRQAIYNAISEKNGTSLAEVSRLYAKRLQGDAPQGAPIETASGWTNK